MCFADRADSDVKGGNNVVVRNLPVSPLYLSDRGMDGRRKVAFSRSRKAADPRLRRVAITLRGGGRCLKYGQDYYVRRVEKIKSDRRI